MTRFLTVGIAALSMVAAHAAQSAEEAGKAFSRDRATAIVGEFRKIVSPRGIDERLKITIGDSQQWISVRGRDSRNPILLFIHGGPASPEMQTSWIWQGAWEDYFTVVQWDQRGAGKSYLANDPGVIASSLSLQRISEDAAEVVQYLRHRYAKDKIFVLGHSWGSVVGLTLARAHPDLLYAYIGMGQVISGPENERVGYRLTLQLAEAQKNTTAIEELKSIAPYPAADGSLTLEQIMLDRKWSVMFGGLTYGRKNLDFFSDLAELSPDYTAADVAAVDKGEALSLPRLLPDLLSFDFSHVTRFECPIFMFEGRYDSTTPSQITADWFKRVQAPKKGFVWFENSAHMIEAEEPGRVLVHLVQDVRPLAGKNAN
jgi:proline iminopeptidase